ncbi:MAG TPA: site-specific tyrosine recombinase XerD, partial [Micromonosporaceae bacterium]
MAAGGTPRPAAALRRAIGGYLDHLTVERGLAGNTLH